MPWMETCPMKERTRFVMALESGAYSMTETCERYGVSRVTGHKWWRRYQEEGFRGIEDRSRRPHRSPGQTPEEITRLIVEVRRKHPRWGPDKLLAVVKRHHPDLRLPARSTVAAILKRKGLVARGHRRRQYRHPGHRMVEVTAPNQLWTADFKGQFKTRNGKYCYPLTIADEHSRYLLACNGLRSTRGKWSRPVFGAVFREHGLPEAIRTDNGPPFAVWNALCGLSELGVWWIQLGIRHHRIEPGKPQQNARHERMHRTLKDHTARPSAANLKCQQQSFDGFRKEFNEERPHQALGQKPPADVWKPSPRPFPEKTPKPEYQAYYEKRKVTCVGHIKFKNQTIFLSSNLLGETVALEEINDGIWSIYYYDVLIARFDEKNRELI